MKPDPTPNNDFSAFDDMMAERCPNGIAYLGIRILGYMDEEGELFWARSVHGDTRLGPILGAMEMAKHEMLVSTDDDE